MEIKVQSAEQALSTAFPLIHLGGPSIVRTTTSRNGAVREFVEPVATIYKQSRLRYVRNPLRDANPFFHFFEALWMLAGRNDVNFPAYIVPRMTEYSDDGMTMQGAYGRRWKTPIDQVGAIINLLKEQPDSRRAVMTMWRTEDLLKLGSSDIPCNTQIYFKLRDGELQMTVCNRSNDMLWGAYGSNVVHFSILQEYMAAKLRAFPGQYTQMSDNLHVYTTGPGGDLYRRMAEGLHVTAMWNMPPIVPFALEAENEDWDEGLKLFFALYDTEGPWGPARVVYDNPYWEKTVKPFWKALVQFKNMDRDKALSTVFDVACPALRVAGAEWLERRSA